MTAATIAAPVADPKAVPAPMPISRNIPTFPVYRLSVERYHQMIEAGILTPEDRIELIEGWLVQKMTKYRPHTLSTHFLRVALEGMVGVVFYVASQEPVTLIDSEPEPDGMVVRGAVRDYLVKQPTAAEVPVVGEVSESSLEFDRTYKKRVYAAARIPVYWIINLMDRQIEVYTDSTGPGPNPTYKKLDTYSPGQNVPVVIDGVPVGEIPVNNLLP